MPVLEHLNLKNGINFRIEGQTYSLKELEYVIEAYQRAIADKSKCTAIYEEMKSCRAGFTLGALSYKYTAE
jgi:putative protease